MRGGPPNVILHQTHLRALYKNAMQQKSPYIRYNSAPNTERWMSGLSHHPGKVAYASVYRGFESLSLRQIKKPRHRRGFLI